MPTRTLGRTGLKVAALCLGGDWALFNVDGMSGRAAT